ncbi:MAG: hypothetical protein Q4G65_05395 [bacterium]|nr:hypothetical protein [bacterium]
MNKVMLVMGVVSVFGIFNAWPSRNGQKNDRPGDSVSAPQGTGHQKDWQSPKGHGNVSREGAGQMLTDHAKKELESKPQHDSRYMREIAQVLGVGFSEEQSVASLAGEIRLFIQDAEDRVPSVRPLSDDVVNALKDVLGPSDFKAVLNMNNGLKKMAEYRLLALPKKFNRK